MNQFTTETVPKIKEKLLLNLNHEGKAKVNSALRTIDSLTQDRYRLNGDPLISHPLMVALKVKSMGLGANSICAAILHDVIEDYPDEEEVHKQIEKELGNDIYGLIKSLSRINSTPAEKSQLSELEAAQKYLLSTVDDLRVIMIKLADKTHNLMTLEGLPEKNQRKYMDEIERIYIPIAEYLGLREVYRELKDMLLYERDQEAFNKVAEFVKKELGIRRSDKNKIVEELEIISDGIGIEADIYGRVKSFSSIHEKTKKYEKEGKGRSLNLIEDIFAFRIIVEKKEQCFEIYSAVQKFYDIVPGSYDDYISNPKKNGYKSLQTTLVHPDFGKFELQIRTYKMHEYNEYGPASHVAYKLSGKRNASATDKFNWVKDINFEQWKSRAFEDKPIPINLFEDTVFVLTPEKDIFSLPKGSTPIDFAYTLHTKVGDQCIGAVVNGRPVSVDTKLKTGDIIEIKTNPNKEYASKSWLDFVITERAKKKIMHSVNRRLYKM